MTSRRAWLIEFLNRFAPPPRTIQELDDAKLERGAYQEWEYAEIRKLAPEFGPRWDLQGRSVLDVGCGLGGKPVFYAEAGARQVTGIDLRFYSVKATLQLGRQRGLPAVQPVNADAARLGFCDDAFDVIVSINVFEHVDDLPAVLAECRRVLRPGGLMFLHFPPFYSPWGAHLEGWINLPWPHVFFPDRVLLEAAARIDACQRRNAAFIPTARFDWAALEQLPELNRVTARQFTRLLRQADLTILEAHMLPFGRHYLLRHGALGRLALAGLRWLATLPLLREVITTKMVFVLTKETVTGDD